MRAIRKFFIFTVEKLICNLRKFLSLVDLNDIKVNANVVEGVSLKCLYFYAYLNAYALICSSKPTTPKVYVVNEAERILISLLLKPLP